MSIDAPSTAQINALTRALHITTQQLHQVEEMLAEFEVQPTPSNKLAMLQVIATNYLAERTKT